MESMSRSELKLLDQRLGSSGLNYSQKYSLSPSWQEADENTSFRTFTSSELDGRYSQWSAWLAFKCALWTATGSRAPPDLV
jgi:hypothetical protein